MPEPFRITRTNTRRYMGTCALCDFATEVMSHRTNCAVRMRNHARDVHGMAADTLNKYLEPERQKGRRMKTPKKELPPLERLSEYEGHLCVFANAKQGTVKSQYGTSECDVMVWVYFKGAWKGLGETPIFWQTVGKQIMEEIGPDSGSAEGESLGAFLRKGGNPTRNGDFFWLDIAQDSPDLALLKAWTKEYSDSF